MVCREDLLTRANLHFLIRVCRCPGVNVGVLVAAVTSSLIGVFTVLAHQSGDFSTLVLNSARQRDYHFHILEGALHRIVSSVHARRKG